MCGLVEIFLINITFNVSKLIYSNGFVFNRLDNKYFKDLWGFEMNWTNPEDGWNEMKRKQIIHLQQGPFIINVIVTPKPHIPPHYDNFFRCKCN